MLSDLYDIIEFSIMTYENKFPVTKEMFHSETIIIWILRSENCVANSLGALPL